MSNKEPSRDESTAASETDNENKTRFAGKQSLYDMSYAAYYSASYYGMLNRRLDMIDIQLDTDLFANGELLGLNIYDNVLTNALLRSYPCFDANSLKALLIKYFNVAANPDEYQAKLTMIIDFLLRTMKCTLELSKYSVEPKNFYNLLEFFWSIGTSKEFIGENDLKYSIDNFASILAYNEQHGITEYFENVVRLLCYIVHNELSTMEYSEVYAKCVLPTTFKDGSLLTDVCMFSSKRELLRFVHCLFGDYNLFYHKFVESDIIKVFNNKKIRDYILRSLATVPSTKTAIKNDPMIEKFRKSKIISERTKKSSSASKMIQASSNPVLDTSNSDLLDVGDSASGNKVEVHDLSVQASYNPENDHANSDQLNAGATSNELNGSSSRFKTQKIAGSTASTDKSTSGRPASSSMLRYAWLLQVNKSVNRPLYEGLVLSKFIASSMYRYDDLIYVTQLLNPFEINTIKPYTEELIVPPREYPFKNIDSTKVLRFYDSLFTYNSRLANDPYESFTPEFADELEIPLSASADKSPLITDENLMFNVAELREHRSLVTAWHDVIFTYYWRKSKLLKIPMNPGTLVSSKLALPFCRSEQTELFKSYGCAIQFPDCKYLPDIRSDDQILPSDRTLFQCVPTVHKACTCEEHNLHMFGIRLEAPNLYTCSLERVGIPKLISYVRQEAKRIGILKTSRSQLQPHQLAYLFNFTDDEINDVRKLRPAFYVNTPPREQLSLYDLLRYDNGNAIGLINTEIILGRCIISPYYIGLFVFSGLLCSIPIFYLLFNFVIIPLRRRRAIS